MPLLKFGGSGDKHVVILHATGFLAAAYQPFAAALGKRFMVWGLDLPGHGTAVRAALPRATQCSQSCDGDHSAPSASAAGRSSHGSGGGGSSSNGELSPISLPGVTQYVINTIQQADLQGCFAFGHSAGGALALLAAGQCPQLFKAVYCFEAVVSTPCSHDFMAAATARGDIHTDGQVLGSMARKRRAHFVSRQAALQHLTAKPPFSRMDPVAVQLYVQHGLIEVSSAGGGGEGDVAAPAAGQAREGSWQANKFYTSRSAIPQQHPMQQQLSSLPPPQQQLSAVLSSSPQQVLQLPQAGGQQALHQAAERLLLHQTHQQQQQEQQRQPLQLPLQEEQQQQQQPVRLLCAPEQEAAYFDALHPPPALDPCSVHCPVLLAVAAAPPDSGGTPAAALSSHEGVKKWFYQQHAGSSKRQLHGSLRVLNCELAAAMPTAQLLEIRGVSHFGPLEQPQLLADSCADFFTGIHACQPQQQQQQQSLSKL